MIDYFFNFENYILYLIGFPIYLIFLFFFFFIGKRKINNNNGITFYGMFMGLSNRNILALSFLFFYYYLVIVSIFVNSFSYINLIMLFVPIVLFHLINFSIIRLVIDIIQTAFIILLLYSKIIFYNYIIDIGNYWYVIVLYVLLCLFVFIYTTYIFVKRFKMVISHNKYIDNKKKK